MKDICFLSIFLKSFVKRFNLVKKKETLFSYFIAKKCLSCLTVFFLLFLVSTNIDARINPANNTAKNAAVIDVETAQVLYGKAMHVKAYPASVTKILTTIVAIEEGNLEDIVTVSRKAAYQEGSSIYLKEGEKIKLKELLYAVMLASGNDAAVAVAEHVAGSVEDFANLMNERARMMGALNSNFRNPHGLPDSNHYTTAYDMAMIMRYAMTNDKFREITKTKNISISWSGNDWGRGLRNHNKLLFSYDDITGGKTGYTRAAGRCLVASASRDGREVIAVVLNDPNDWLDVRNLLDFALDSYKKQRVFDKGDILYTFTWEKSKEKDLSLVAAEGVQVLIPKGGKLKLKQEIYLNSELELPIKKGDIIGYLKISDDEKLLARVDLLAYNDMNYNSIFLRFWNWLVN
ncbi:D-alanyl-D-alanine carboxypeptidase family protein [Natronospora cellulosivora (SeqCode)]